MVSFGTCQKIQLSEADEELPKSGEYEQSRELSKVSEKKEAVFTDVKKNGRVEGLQGWVGRNLYNNILKILKNFQD